MNSLDGFTVVDYLTVFTAFVYGFVATRFFYGWSALINFRHYIKFSKEHLAWTFITFGLLIDVWWGSWQKGDYLHQHIGLYYVSLLSPFGLYLLSVILFPHFSDEKFYDLKEYFRKYRNRFYKAYLVLFLAFVLDFIFFPYVPKSDLIFDGIAITLLVIGIFVANQKYHNFVMGIALVMLMVHLFMRPEYNITRVTLNVSLREYLTIFSGVYLRIYCK